MAQSSERFLGWAGSALLLPRVAWLAIHAPKDWRAGWERYWANVHSTGVGGDVLWDSGDLDEIPHYQALIREHLDTSLPLVDVGCGNGRFTRRLAPLFPATIGVDLAANAVSLARAESSGEDMPTFAPVDITDPRAGSDIRSMIDGDANVFVRGVFHVLDPPDRAAAARNLHTIVGIHGRVLLAETNFPGSKMQYLRHLGATPRRIPRPLERAIADIPAPGHFGAGERGAAFPARDWRVVADGATDILTIPLRGATAAEHIPGYYAVLASRSAGTDGTAR